MTNYNRSFNTRSCKFLKLAINALSFSWIANVYAYGHYHPLAMAILAFAVTTAAVNCAFDGRFGPPTTPPFMAALVYGSLLFVDVARGEFGSASGLAHSVLFFGNCHSLASHSHRFAFLTFSHSRIAIVEGVSHVAASFLDASYVLLAIANALECVLHKRSSQTLMIGNTRAPRASKNIFRRR